MRRNNVVTLNNIEIVGPTLTVTTSRPSNIDCYYAHGHATVTTTPTSCGFVYALKSDVSNPSDELVLNSSDPKIKSAVADSPSTNYWAALTPLLEDSYYYVRAWAKNETGAVSYGAVIEMETRLDYTKAPYNGMLPGVFTGDNAKFRFSMGNLQYNKSTNKWRYANQQYEYVGYDNGTYGNVIDIIDNTVVQSDNNAIILSNGNVNTSYKGWVDVFPWGTSGYDHGAGKYQPWVRYYNGSPSSNQFYAYGSQTAHLYDNTGKADWGYNPIINGENAEGRTNKFTINNHQIHNIVNVRSATTLNGVTNARFAFAKLTVRVNQTVQGVLIFPDALTWPSGVPYPTHINEGGVNADGSATYDWSAVQTFTEEQWIKLEKAGVVFLPCGGCWGTGNQMGWQNRGGRYWTSVSDHATSPTTDKVYQFAFSPEHKDTDGGVMRASLVTQPYYGFCVRLVRYN
jgi:hypothetical protein